MCCVVQVTWWLGSWGWGAVCGAERGLAYKGCILCCVRFGAL